MTLGLPENFYNNGLELVAMDANIFQTEDELIILMKELAIEIQEVIKALQRTIARNPYLDYSELRLKLYNYYSQAIKNLSEDRDIIII